MFGRKPPQTPEKQHGTLSSFFLRNIILLGVSFLFAFLFAPSLVQNIPWLVLPIGQLFGALIPQANDPFWVSYILIYAFISSIIWTFRWATGSRI